MIWLSISSGNGPEECAHAVALTVKVMLQEIHDISDMEITARLIEAEPSYEKGNIRFALLVLNGQRVKAFADSWTGIIQWGLCL